MFSNWIKVIANLSLLKSPIAQHPVTVRYSLGAGEVFVLTACRFRCNFQFTILHPLLPLGLQSNSILDYVWCNFLCEFNEQRTAAFAFVVFIWLFSHRSRDAVLLISSLNTHQNAGNPVLVGVDHERFRLERVHFGHSCYLHGAPVSYRNVNISMDNKLCVAS